MHLAAAAWLCMMPAKDPEDVEKSGPCFSLSTASVQAALQPTSSCCQWCVLCSLLRVCMQIEIQEQACATIHKWTTHLKHLIKYQKLVVYYNYHTAYSMQVGSTVYGQLRVLYGLRPLCSNTFNPNPSKHIWKTEKLLQPHAHVRPINWIKFWARRIAPALIPLLQSAMKSLKGASVPAPLAAIHAQARGGMLRVWKPLFSSFLYLLYHFW